MTTQTFPVMSIKACGCGSEAVLLASSDEDDEIASFFKCARS